MPVKRARKGKLLSLSERNRWVAAVAAVVPLLASGCGVEQATDPATRATTQKGLAVAGQLGPGYGISVKLPPSWSGKLRRGAFQAATFPLPGGSALSPMARKRMTADDVFLAIYENEPRPGSPPNLADYPHASGNLRLGAHDFQPYDGVTEDSRATGHGYARRVLEMSDRFFVLFAETGERVPSTSVLGALNDLLASFAVEPGDFFPGTVQPAHFPDRTGWFVGTSGADEGRAEGEFTTAWASTIAYADQWDALPPQATLERLPRDGMVIWVSLSRSNRFPPDQADKDSPARHPPFALSDFERQAGWEGQVGGVPQYVLWGTMKRQYQIDLRVYFGRPDPTKAMLAEAQKMLNSLKLPDWGPWEAE